MEKKNYPNHRIESIQLPEDSNDSPEIYAAANFESDYRIHRRDFLSVSAGLAGLAIFLPALLQGCATSKITVKVPKTVLVKKGTHLFDSPDGNTVRIAEKDELLDFVEEQNNYVKVKDQNNNLLYVKKMEAIYEDYTEKTQACGTPIPSGYTCTCNCVPVSSPRTTRTNSYTICKCNQVCTCNLVPVYR